MLTILLIWLYISFLSFVLGFTFLSFVKKTNLIEGQISESFSFISIVGFSVISTITGYYSIFYKVGLILNIFLFLFSILSTIIYKKEINKIVTQLINNIKNTPNILLLLYPTVFLLILVKSTDQPIYGDTGLYHAQCIKWINEYKVVPGLGNFHGRFAFNNHSFLVEALFSFSFMKTHTFHLVNSYLAILFSFTLIHQMGKSLIGSDKYGIIWIGLLYLYRHYFNVHLSSPAADIFSTTLIWFIFIIFIETIQEAKLNFSFNLFSIILLSVFSITVKISSLFILLLPAIILIKIFRKNLYKTYLFAFFMALFFAIPFFIRNLFLSGFLIYPVPYLNIFSFDWKIPVEQVSFMKDLLCSWTKTWSFEPGTEQPFSKWFPIWFKRQLLFDLILLSIATVSPIILILYQVITKKIDSIMKSELLIITISFAGILFWFFTAPDFRYAIAFLCINVLFTIFIGYKTSEKLFINDCNRVFTISQIKNILKPIKFCTLYFCFFLLILAFSRSISTSPLKRILMNNILLPEKYEQAKLKKITDSNYSYFVPYGARWPFCWNSDLPCSPDRIGSHIELRGDTIETGFRNK
jgi:hypothetical protein